MRRNLVRTAKLVETALTAAAVLAGAVAVSLLILPQLVGWQPVVVLSGSMEPGIPVGGLAFLETVKASEVRAGEVISYEVGNSRVTHRVIEVVTGPQGERAFVTKGDANAEPDAGVVQPSQVDSREVFTVPYLGLVAHQIGTRVGFIMLIGLPALTIISGELVNIGKQASRTRRKATG